MPEPSDYAAWIPKPSVEQREQASLERQKLTASYPVIEQVLAWFDEQIETFSNPQVIDGANVSTPAEDIKLAVLFAQSNIASYSQKKAEFISRFSEFIKPEETPSETA